MQEMLDLDVDAAEVKPVQEKKFEKLERGMEILTALGMAVVMSVAVLVIWALDPEPPQEVEQHYRFEK